MTTLSSRVTFEPWMRAICGRIQSTELECKQKGVTHDGTLDKCGVLELENGHERAVRGVLVGDL
jgi:hypothetical protein